MHACMFPAMVLKCVFVQREYQRTLEQTVEELKQKEATATEKQQELTACLSLDDYEERAYRKEGG